MRERELEEKKKGSFFTKRFAQLVFLFRSGKRLGKKKKKVEVLALLALSAIKFTPYRQKQCVRQWRVQTYKAKGERKGRAIPRI